MVAIPTPVVLPAMFMVANNDILTIATNNLRRRRVSDGEYRRRRGT